jgi:hypothetical protein
MQAFSISLPVQICRPEYHPFHLGRPSSASPRTSPTPPSSSKTTLPSRPFNASRRWPSCRSRWQCWR